MIVRCLCLCGATLMEVEVNEDGSIQMPLHRGPQIIHECDDCSRKWLLTENLVALLA